jgi:ABC-type Fe3+-siderophore transport system permease subunit
LVGVGLISIGLGAVRIPITHVLLALSGQGPYGEQLVVWDFRLPRIVLGMFVGADLAVSGVILQGVTGNPLASPAVVGINGGAGMGAVAVAFLAPLAPGSVISAAAIAGGLASAGVVYFLARKGGVISPVRLALVGVAAGGFTLAIIQLFIVRFVGASDNVQVALRWLTGSLWGVTWTQVAEMVPASLLLLPIAWLLGSRLDVVVLGDDIARSLGSRLETLRGILLVTAVALAATAVAVAGTIAFVGLIAPHLCRRLVGPRHRVLIVASALTGALLVLGSDLVGRTGAPPSEVPVGLLTAVLGAPYFLHLLRSRID